jgi:hypothetical protein
MKLKFLLSLALRERWRRKVTERVYSKNKNFMEKLMFSLYSISEGAPHPSACGCHLPLSLMQGEG